MRLTALFNEHSGVFKHILLQSFLGNDIIIHNIIFLVKGK